MEYSNDCLYLTEQARKIALCINIRSVEDAETLRGQLKDVAEKLECIGESWLQEVIVGSSDDATMKCLSDVVAGLLGSRNSRTQGIACQGGPICGYERRYAVPPCTRHDEEDTRESPPHKCCT